MAEPSSDPHVARPEATEAGASSGHDRRWPVATMTASVLALPMVELVAANPNEPVDIGWLLALWVALVLAAALVLLGIRRLLGETVLWRSAVVFAVGVWMFFNAQVVQAPLEPLGLPLLSLSTRWAVVAVAALGLTWLASRSRPLRTFGAVLAPALLLVPVVQVTVAQAGATTGSGGAVLTRATPAPAPLDAITPDVYYLMLDGYGRPDVLRDYGIESPRQLVDELAERSFYVSRDSFANYPATYVSVASTLEMTYLGDPGDQVADRTPFYAVLGGHNETVRRLTARGYAYLHASPPLWAGSQCTDVADVCVRPDGMLGETQRALLERTPLAPFVLRHVRSGYVARHTDPSFLVEQAVRTPTSSPRFLFAHVFAPHPPHLRRADCSQRPIRAVGLQMWEPDLYAQAVQCLNKQLVEAVDRILELSDDPVIIIQSDHGPAFDVDFTAITGVEERLANLSAIRLPAQCDLEVPANLTPVNTFRLVFACLDADPTPSLLPNRYHWLDYDEYVVTSVDPGQD